MHRTPTNPPPTSPAPGEPAGPIDFERWNELMLHGASLPRPPIGWAVLELLGHRRELGYLSEEEIAGVRFLRLATPVWNSATEDWASDSSATTIFVSTQAIYAIAPSSEWAVRDEIAPWIECGAPVAVQVEGSDDPAPQPCALRRGHDGDHDPLGGLADLPF